MSQSSPRIYVKGDATKKADSIEMTEEQKTLFSVMTSMQQNICIASLAGKNDIDAYYAGGGKSKTRLSAEATVSKLLSNTKVKAFLASMKQDAVKGAVMDRTEMLERLSTLARVNMSDLIEWRTTLSENAEGEEVEQSCWSIKESAQLDGHTMAAIAEVTAGKEGFKIKQHSPLAAMKQLADLEGFNAAAKTELTVKTVELSKQRI